MRERANGLLQSLPTEWAFVYQARAFVMCETREVIESPGLVAHLRLDPQRQLIGAQCSGTLVLAAWVLARLQGLDAAASALHYVAPVGEKEAFVERALSYIRSSLPQARPLSCN